MILYRFVSGITDTKFLSQMIKKTASLKRFFLQQTTTFVVFLLRPCDKDSPYKIVVVTLDDLLTFYVRIQTKITRELNACTAKNMILLLSFKELVQKREKV